MQLHYTRRAAIFRLPNKFKFNTIEQFIYFDKAVSGCYSSIIRILSFNLMIEIAKQTTTLTTSTTFAQLANDVNRLVIKMFSLI